MKITQIVRYHVKADMVEKYTELSQLLDNFFKNQPGFISRKVRQDLHDKTLFADIAEWENLEEAENAGKIMREEASLKECGEALAKMLSYDTLEWFNDK